MKERVVMHIWTCVAVVLVAFYLVQLIWNTIYVWEISDGITLTIDAGGIAQIVLVLCVYFLSKHLLIQEGE